MATTETKPSETKHWLTPKRIARGPEAARAELRRWSMTAFRPALLKGEHPRDIREAALAAERARGQAEKIAATVTAQEHPRAYKRALSSALAREAGDVGAPLLYRGPEPLLTPGFAVAGLAAVGLGFLAGRWWAHRRKKPTQTVTGSSDLDNPYFHGTCVLAAV